MGINACVNMYHFLLHPRAPTIGALLHITLNIIEYSDQYTWNYWTGVCAQAFPCLLHIQLLEERLQL